MAGLALRNLPSARCSRAGGGVASPRCMGIELAKRQAVRPSGETANRTPTTRGARIMSDRFTRRLGDLEKTPLPRVAMLAASLLSLPS
jgi:hypothetical protein